MKNLKRIRDSVESYPPLKWLMPAKKTHTWDIGELNFGNNCTLDAFGTGSSIRGGHYHLIVIDDPSKDHWTISLSQQKNFFFGVVMPALRKDGQLIVTGTPVDIIDFLYELEQSKKFPLFKFPALNDLNEPLWPEQYSFLDLMERKSLIGNHLFSREYMLKRTSPEDAPFKEQWIKFYDSLPDTPFFTIMTVDPAMNQEGDAMGIVVTATNPLNNSYVLFTDRFNDTVQNNINTIFNLFLQFKPDVFGIETFIFQKLLKLWIEEEQVKRNIFFPICELEKEGVRKTYKARIMSLQPKLQSGKLFFRNNNQDEFLIQELLNWDMDSKSNIDDILTALSHQVPLWDSPISIPTQASNSGTFQEAFDNINKPAFSDFSQLWNDLL